MVRRETLAATSRIVFETAAPLAHLASTQGAEMKRMVMLIIVLFLGSAFAMAQHPLYGVGTKNVDSTGTDNQGTDNQWARSGVEGRDYNRIDVYGGYSLGIAGFGNPTFNGTSSFPPIYKGFKIGLPKYNGFDSSVAVNLARWFSVEGDFTYQRDTLFPSGSSVNVLSLTTGTLSGNITTNNVLFSGGPRFAYRQGRVAPFAHILIGVDRLGLNFPGSTLLNGTAPAFAVTNSAIVGIFGGGVDIDVHRHVAIRSQVDYIPANHTFALPSGVGTGSLGFSMSNYRIGFGLVGKF